MKIFLTNLGKYNEGELVGQWLCLPCSNERLEEALKEIGVDGVQYEEYFITDYESDIGLDIGEYENLQTLNELAEQVCTLNKADQLKLKAIIEHESPDPADVMNILDKLDEYTLHASITTERELGYYYIHEIGNYDLIALGELAEYLDYEAYGRDILHEIGGSLTSYGWLECKH